MISQGSGRVGGSQPQKDPSDSLSKWSCLLYVLWSVPVVHFSLNPTLSPAAWPIWTAVAGTLCLSLIDARLVALGIPFVGLFSPLAKSTLILGLLPSEIFLTLCSAFVLMANMRKGFWARSPERGILIALLAIVVVSYVFSSEQESLLKSLFNWGAICAVYLVTGFYASSKRFVEEYLRAIVVLSGMASLIILSAYDARLSLAHFFGQQEGGLNFVDLQFFYRASFWYTNVLFVLGSGFLAAMCQVFYAKSFVAFGSNVIAMALVLQSVLISYTKTAMAGVLVSAVTLSLVHIRKLRTASARSLLIVVGGIACTLLYAVPMVAEQADNLNQRFESVEARLDIYELTLGVLLEDPFRLVVGYGPDASTLLASQTTDFVRTGPNGEGAIDSAYITYLFEHGLFFLILLLVLLIRMIWSSFRQVGEPAGDSYVQTALLAIQIFLAVAALAQVVGTSKVAWVVVGLLSLRGNGRSQARSISGPGGLQHEGQMRSVAVAGDLSVRS